MKDLFKIVRAVGRHINRANIQKYTLVQSINKNKFRQNTTYITSFRK